MDRSESGLEISGGPGLKQVMVAMSLIFVGVLAVIVAKQMSAEAMAVVIGIICGVLAAIPTSLLLLVVLTRSERRRYDEEDRKKSQRQYPPVVVIQGGAPQALPPGTPAGYWPSPAPGPLNDRQWQVVGGEDLLEDRRWQQ
ncbi:MAG: hypothetical protein P8129_13160 [Anaerolineae bacterium]|jgi:hypothetical protein